MDVLHVILCNFVILCPHIFLLYILIKYYTSAGDTDGAEVGVEAGALEDTVHAPEAEVGARVLGDTIHALVLRGNLWDFKLLKRSYQA